MQIQILLVNLFAIGSFISTASADISCYRGGQYEHAGTLIRHAENACQGYNGNRGAFQGTFKPKEKTSVCVNVGSNRLNMEVQNLNPSASFDLKDSDCVKEFRFIGNTCRGGIWAPALTQGGTNTVAGWYFKLDPNRGNC